MGDVVVGVWSKPFDQEKEVTEALFRQLEQALHLHSLVLMGNFNNVDICWSDNTTGRRKPQRFLQHTDEKFLT